LPLVIANPASGGGRRRNNRPRTAAGTPAPNNPRDDYDRRLRRYVAQYLGPTAQKVTLFYAQGATVDEIAAILDRLQVETADTLSEIALKDLQGWFTDIDGYNKKRFEDSIRRTMGIDAKSILDPVLADETRREAISENVALIRGMTRKFHGDIMDAIVTDYRGDAFPDDSKSLAGRIQNLTGMAKERASFIARDQTAKLNSILAEARQIDAGVTHYEWRTTGDMRVVGKPGGLYPKGSLAHNNHYERNGKIFSWKKPPLDGHPGQAIGCRCIAAPILNPAELRMVDLTTETVRYRETG
jgi:uncharacterized protein with gpF-like domain